MIVGIDPGVTGAIAIIHSPTDLEFYDMPTCLAGKTTDKRRVDGAALFKLISSIGFPDAVYCELVTGSVGRPKPPCPKCKQVPVPGGAMGKFAFGRSYGAVQTVAETLCDNVEYIGATVWKRHFALPGGRENKKLSLALAKEMVPENFHDQLKLVKHEARAEAYLIARCGKERNQNQIGERQR